MTFCRFDSRSDKFKFKTKGLNERTLEDAGDGPMSNCSRFLDGCCKFEVDRPWIQNQKSLSWDI